MITHRSSWSTNVVRSVGCFSAPETLAKSAWRGISLSSVSGTSALHLPLFPRVT